MPSRLQVYYVLLKIAQKNVARCCPNSKCMVCNVGHKLTTSVNKTGGVFLFFSYLQARKRLYCPFLRSKKWKGLQKGRKKEKKMYKFSCRRKGRRRKHNIEGTEGLPQPKCKASQNNKRLHANLYSNRLNQNTKITNPATARSMSSKEN